MLKNKLTILLMLAVLSAGAFAQSIPSGTGRIEALGNSPFIMDAATDINNNPAWNNYYRDYTFGDIGRNVVSDFELSDQYAGVTFGVGKKLNLGLVLNKRDDQFESFRIDSLYPGNNSPIVPTKLLIGYSWKKDLHLGLAPYITMYNSEFTTTNYNDKRSSNSFGASLGVLKMIKKGWVEGVVNFRLNSYKRDVTSSDSSGSTVQTWKSEGGTSFGVGLRAWIYPKTSSKIAVVPILGFSTYSWNPRYTTTGFDSVGTKHSWLTINGGVGLNIPISDDIQLAGGVSVAYNRAKHELGTSTFTVTDFIAPQFNLAGETAIADWLTARLGYSRSVDMYKEEGVSGSTTTTYTETRASSNVQTVSLGTGFHFGRFSIDATVSEKWLKHGINFVSGGDNTDLFGVVSASYNFAK